MRQPQVRAAVYTPERSRKIIQVKAANGTLRVGNRGWSGGPKSESTKQKLREAHLRSGHQPRQRGGNGQPLPKPQALMLEAMGSTWIAEHAIALGGRLPGYPTCYKVDLGYPAKKLAIECDGNSHLARKAKDQKKDAKLAELGWTVLRLKNTEILSMCSILSLRAVRTSVWKRLRWSTTQQP